MSKSRPRTSQSSLTAAPLSMYLPSYKKLPSNTDHQPTLAPKFTRNRYKQEQSLDFHTEHAYNTRNGVLNTSAGIAKKPGGNGYCNILRLKRAVAQARESETVVDRRIRVMKAEFSRNGSPLIDRSTGSEPYTSVFLTAEQASYRRLPGSIATPELGKTRVVPVSFQHAAIRCVCEDSSPCLCGKRDLRYNSSTSLNVTHEKIADILNTCDSMSKETTSTKAEMRVQLGQVKQKLNLYARHTNLIMMGMQRAKYFNLRKKFQVATRVRPI